MPTYSISWKSSPSYDNKGKRRYENLRKVLYLKEKESSKETWRFQNFKAHFRDSLIYHCMFSMKIAHCIAAVTIAFATAAAFTTTATSLVYSGTRHTDTAKQYLTHNTCTVTKSPKIRGNHEWDFCYDVTAYFLQVIQLELTKHAGNLRSTSQLSLSTYQTLSHFFSAQSQWRI